MAVAGDAAVLHIEALLAARPDIAVPAIAIDGDRDGVGGSTEDDMRKFTGVHEYRVFKDAGHNLPQEKPADWARAVLDARALSS